MKRIKDYLAKHPGSLATIDLEHDLDSVEYKERDLVFSELLKRVEIGGFVYLKGTDIRELCGSVYSGNIGDPIKVFSSFKSLSCLDLVYNQLTSAGFEILISERQNIQYYVVGKRHA